MATRNYFRKFVGNAHPVVLFSLFMALTMSSLVWADTLHIADDAHIDLASPSDNNGNDPNLEVSNIVSRKSGEKYTFLSYELIPLPAGANLEKAYLRLYVGKVHTAGLIDLYLVTQTWDEESINGLNQPTLDALPFADFSLTYSDEGHFVIIDVTPEVQMWLEGTVGNYGFALVGNPGTDVTATFDSKENPQSSHPTELELILGVAEGGVDSSDIEDGSITTDDIADNSISGTDILDGSIGESDIDKDAIQLRVNGTCAAGSSIRVIDNMGNVTCEADDDSGDITSVYPSAGGGLNGGTDVGDAELGIAPDGVNSSMIADGSVGANDVDNNGVQLRVTGTCPAGSAIRVIANTGNVTCEADGDSGGDITSVFPSAGGGLTGGASSGDAELGIAPDSVNSSMIADGSVGAIDVDSSDVQLRVDGSCPAGSSIRSIHASGTATCEVDDFEADTTLDANLFWKVAGNAGTNPIPVGPHFLGTTDNKSLVLGANSQQILRMEFIAHVDGDSVNILGGHSANMIINARGAVIAGGGTPDWPNKIEASYGSISGGWGNSVLDSNSTIGGGRHNLITNYNSTIGGGSSNKVESFNSVVAGGQQNRIYRSDGTIGGGARNRICDPADFPLVDFPLSVGSRSTISGGSDNMSCGSQSSIGGGRENTSTGDFSMVIGGWVNEAFGEGSIVGGFASSAEQDYGIALGYRAKSLHEGAFVWSDNSLLITPFESEREHQFRARATGGARFDVGDDDGSISALQWVDIRAQGLNTLGNAPNDFRLIDTSTGAYLSLGGGWVSSSDRNRKADFNDVDVRTVLEQLASVPILSWRYKVEDAQVRHIGPMAQDFHAVFGLGANPKGIMSIDADGVALAAIQALYKVTKELEYRTAELEVQTSRIESLEASFEELKSQMAPFTSQRHLTVLSN